MAKFGAFRFLRSQKMMNYVLLFILLGLLTQHFFGLDNSLIDRDLYKDLGLKSDASLQEIKKAFRKLAQIHHPDKSRPSNKEANEAIFREVAAAYEVLSDTAQKQEYDSIRRHQQNERNRPHSQSSQRMRDQHRQKEEQQYDSYNRDFRGDESYARNFANDFTFTAYRPIIAGSIMPAMQIILPYSLLLVSEDRTHFALLDMHCSLGVYRGDADVFIRHLLVADRPPDLTMLPLEMRYRTDGDSTLQGQCFAGLDDAGVLHVYKGHPDYYDRLHPLWSSGAPVDADGEYNRYLRRFFLELTDSGELAVRMQAAGTGETECVWSTTSCNAYVALLKDMAGQVSRIFTECSAEIKEIIIWFRRQTAPFYTHFSNAERWREKLRKAKHMILNRIAKIRKSELFERFFRSGWKSPDAPFSSSWFDTVLPKAATTHRKDESTQQKGGTKRSGENNPASSVESGAARRKKRRSAAGS